jgi:holliday junction DNA helicase RuvB
MSRPEITTPEALSDENAVELSLRPQRLAEFIGQSRIKESLSIAIEAAKQRRQPMDHALFHGPPGLGKTTLADLIAREMGVNLITASGPTLEKPGDLVGPLTNLRSGDVLFIDEIHRLRPIIEEFLYPAMEDCKIDMRLSDGPKAQTVTLTLEPFTLIGATTKYGMLTPPLRSRFGNEYRLIPYPVSDLEIIVKRAAQVLRVEITDEGAHELARRSRSTPRVAIRLLRRVRDFAQVRANGVIDADVAAAALAQQDVDHLGLDDMDRRVLRVIIEMFDGGPVGLNTVAAAIGDDAGTIEDVYEPFLMQNGLVQRTSRGRVATAHAYRHLGITLPKHLPDLPDQPALF